MPTPPEPLWSIGGVSFHVDEYSGGETAVIGEQHVLDATKSTKHHSGSMGQTARIAGTLFDTSGSSPKLGLLRSYARTDDTYALTSDVGDEGTFYIKDVQYDRVQALNYDVPVYRVTVELAIA